MELLPTSIEECHKLVRLSEERTNLLTKEIELLKAENRELKERLNNNSSNSSLPPSKNFKKKKKNVRNTSGKKSGGQIGHKGSYRKLMPSEEVDTVEKCVLPSECLCGGEIQCNDDYMRHQVYELPKLKLSVTEYQLQKSLLFNM